MYELDKCEPTKISASVFCNFSKILFLNKVGMISNDALSKCLSVIFIRRSHLKSDHFI